MLFLPASVRNFPRCHYYALMNQMIDRPFGWSLWQGSHRYLAYIEYFRSASVRLPKSRGGVSRRIDLNRVIPSLRNWLGTLSSGDCWCPTRTSRIALFSKMHLTPAARHLWSFVANFGDIAVIMPAYLAAAVALALHKRHLDAIVWGLALLACAGIAALFKIEIGAFNITLFGHGIRSASFPSGHASLSFVFYGGLAMLIWYGSTSWFGRLSAVMLLAAETLIAIAVFVLGWHPLIDVLSGLLLGAVCVAALTPIAMNRRRPRREVATVLAAAVLLLSVMHGARFDERALDGISMKPVFLPRG